MVLSVEGTAVEDVRSGRGRLGVGNVLVDPLHHLAPEGSQIAERDHEVAGDFALQHQVELVYLRVLQVRIEVSDGGNKGAARGGDDLREVGRAA